MTFRYVLTSVCFLLLLPTLEVKANTTPTAMHHDHQHGEHSDSPMAGMTEHSMDHKPHTGSGHVHSTEEQTMDGTHSPGHNGHDQQDTMQNHGSGRSMMMMMYFHLTGDMPLFFEGWDLSSAGVIAGATIVLAVIAALYEGLKMLREILMTKTVEKIKQRELQGHKSSSSCCDDGPYIRLPFMDHLLQTVLHMLQILISYLLMLAVMTYNVWLLLGVVVGAGIGYFVVAFYVPRKRQTSLSRMSEHCH